MTKTNPTFCGAEPTWANACVGNNGNPSYVEYSIGFSKAANILIDLVLKDRSNNLSVDEFVYPVCFNMRHSVELRLKGAIDELIEIAKIKKITLNFNSSGSHDIESIWTFFKTQSGILDSRYSDINKKIEPTILDIAQVDPTGQTFRYALSNTAQKHLTDVSLINFIVLKDKFNELELNLDKLHQLNTWLQTEYRQGTFTTKLSRPQIFKIAKKLPHTDKWREAQFTEIKEQVKTEYDLGSRDFSKVIDIIRCHYSLAPIIGAPLPIKGITEPQLLFFIDEWIKKNPDIKKAPDSSFTEISFDKESVIARMLARAIEKTDIWDTVADEVCSGYLAGLESLFYFARDTTFTEYYNTIYDIHTREANNTLKFNKTLKDDFMHIFNKTSALNNILLSLYALGHAKLAESIITTHELEISFRWLHDARTGQRFIYPDFAAY
ncbi:hypothetical protein [Pseudomonas fluorescens]|uniref:Uncharacterized protein n=1 Tax=Pseudomonas fluorescens TaxID=294 RepID=A0A5E6U5D7_PSEFL|nr:hypothetical protein [Pseudomonas fluorescens]VVM99787.1 hypothetical protein PS624_03266 [Pseudomonas fluorescens]